MNDIAKALLSCGVALLLAVIATSSPALAAMAAAAFDRASVLLAQRRHRVALTRGLRRRGRP